jgi:hypothetical protein
MRTQSDPQILAYHPAPNPEMEGQDPQTTPQAVGGVGGQTTQEAVDPGIETGP